MSVPFPGHVCLPVAIGDVRASIALSAMCPSTFLLGTLKDATMMPAPLIMILLIATCALASAESIVDHFAVNDISEILILQNQPPDSNAYTKIVDRESLLKIKASLTEIPYAGTILERFPVNTRVRQIYVMYNGDKFFKFELFGDVSLRVVPDAAFYDGSDSDKLLSLLPLN